MKFIAKILLALCMLVLPHQICASEGSGLGIVEGTVPISMGDAQKLMEQNGTYIFDANTKQVREQYGYIPGSIFINIENWTSLLPKDKDATLLFYCLNNTCYTSSDAAYQAQQLGYKKVYVMLEGIERWIISGRKVEKDINKNLLVKNGSWSDGKGVANFHDSIHANMYYGEIPSCRDCHGSKTSGIKVELANDKNFVNANCGTCHEKPANGLSMSAHAKAKNPKKDVPLCTDCHGVHTQDKAGFTLSRKQLSDAKCGSCHEKEEARYLDTFHGKAMHLNSPGSAPEVAACFDCHGKHRIMAVDNVNSRLHIESGNRIKTCAKCHEGANAGFSNEFIAHADHSDKEKYPVLYWAYILMTGLLISVFLFFGSHTLMWSIRLICFRIQNKELWKAHKEKEHKDRVKIRRFKPHNMIMHFFVAASFLGLAFSGLPQKFYTAPWAQEMVNLMGGPMMATKIHHISAIIMMACFVLHCIEIAVNTYKKRDELKDENGKINYIKALFGPDSLFPRKQDFKDMWANFMWFIGKGDKPVFDRWTYWEKFDYLAVFWGMVVIGFSGLVLWFPVFFGSFLPGWFVNLSTIVHSDEALLATGFIFAIHFFNTHFRADRFPMDTVIFSGVITEEEMKFERKPWYDRLVATGKLEKLKEENDKFKSYEWIAKLVGYAMLATGMVFLFLIIYAFIHSLIA